MVRDLINLLPPERRRSFRREYFIRLATVAMLLIAALVIVNGIFLLPSYLSVSAEVAARERALADASRAPADASADVAALASLTSDATYLSRLGAAPSASAALRAILSVPRPGVTIESLAATPPVTKGGTGTLVVSGTASTREALRAYDLALSGLPSVSNVDLPVSAYAEESDIVFTMTLTGTFSP